MSAPVDVRSFLDQAVKVLNDARIGGFADSLRGVSEASAKDAFRRIAGRLAYAEEARAAIEELLRDGWHLVAMARHTGGPIDPERLADALARCGRAS